AVLAYAVGRGVELQDARLGHVVIDDRKRGRGLAAEGSAAGGAAEGEVDCLIALYQGVVGDRHGERPRGLPRGEGERAAGGGVIAGGGGGAVVGPVVDRPRAVPAARARPGDGGGPAVFVHAVGGIAEL